MENTQSGAGQKIAMDEDLRVPSEPLPWKILLFSLFLFGFSIFIFFGLRLGYANYLSSRSDKLDARMAELASQVSQEDQQNLIAFYSQIVNMREVLGRHQFTGNAFDLLEKYTLPTVTFSNMSVMGETRTINLDGQAKTMSDLIEQMSVFDNAEEIDGDATIEKISFSGSSVSFSLVLKITESAFSRL